MKAFWLAVALAVAAAGPAQAADWAVDAEQSHIYFAGEQTGNAFKGEFARFTADIVFDPETLDQASAVVDVDLASAATGNKQRDTALPNETWFDVDNHPMARFETTAFRHLEGDRYAADARLTIRGVTEDITLPFTLSIDGDTARVVGETTVNRLDFGVGTGNFSEGKWVSAEIAVTVDLVAVRAAP